MLTKLKKIDFQKNFKITQKISQVQFNISINIKEHVVSRLAQNYNTSIRWQKMVKFDKKNYT